MSRRIQKYPLGPTYGGMNSSASPSVIQNGVSPNMDGFIERFKGAESAAGWALFTSQQLTNGAASPTASEVLSILEFDKRDGTSYGIAITKNRAYSFDNATSKWLPITPGTKRSTTISAVTVSTFVACADTGTGRFQTSPDGITWTGRTEAETNALKDVCWSPKLKLFCAVSTDGTTRVQTSPDGITWTGRTAAEANQWYSVCWSDYLGIFCAVAGSGTHRVMTSSDGITWSTQTAAEANTWSRVTWSPELKIFCAVSLDGTNRVMTSPDGSTWTARSASVADGWQSVRWSTQLSLFCATSAGGSGKIMTSPDGVTWTTRTELEANNKRGLAWSPENNTWVNVMQSGTIKATTSPDGITWTSRTASGLYFDVCWSRRASMFAAVGNNTAMSSPDGITWTSRTASAANEWFSLCFGTNATMKYERAVFVSSTTGYSAGDSIVINEGGVTEEFGVVDSVGTGVLILVDPLSNDHSAAETVRRTYSAAYVDSDSASGQKVLSVSHTGQFSVGEDVVIGLGTSRVEIGTINTISSGVSITLVDNLTYSHTSVQADKVYRMEELSFPSSASEIDYCVANDNLYFTDGVNAIQVFDGAGTPKFHGNLAGLDTGDSVEDVGTLSTPIKAKCVRAFEEFIVIGNLTEEGESYPQKIRWSQYQEPTIWVNEADGTGQAGFWTFTGPENILRLEQLKRELMVYRQTVHEGMSYIGVPNIFAFRRANSDGIIGKGALANLEDSHQLLAPFDAHITDGISSPPVGGDIKDQMFNELTPAYKESCKLFWLKYEDEIIYGIPTGSDGTITKGYVYSTLFKRWVGTRPLAGTAFGYYTRQTARTWDGTSGSWDSQSSGWNAATRSESAPVKLMGDANGYIYVLDENDDQNGVDFTRSYYTKITNFDVPGSKRVFWVRIGLGPLVSGVATAYLGYADDPGDAIVFGESGTLVLTGGGNGYVEFDTTAKFFQLRIDTTGYLNPREIEFGYIPREDIHG